MITVAVSDGGLTSVTTFTFTSPIEGDYDGDGKTDLALYRPSTGSWYLNQSSTNYTGGIVQPWGISTDIPLAGDYDGDGRSDLAIYRPSTGTWFLKLSSGGRASTSGAWHRHP